MLAAVLDLHLTKVGSQVAQDLKENMYVDNILSGCSTEDELEVYYKQSQELMSQANFNLHSWSSNSHRLQVITARDKTRDPNSTIGLLGLNGTLLLTQFLLLQGSSNTFVTKRDILQVSKYMTHWGG